MMRMVLLVLLVMVLLMFMLLVWLLRMEWVLNYYNKNRNISRKYIIGDNNAMLKPKGGQAGPRSWPLMGCHYEAAKNFHRFHDWCHSFFSDERRTVSLAFFSTRIYLTVDPANVQHILHTNFSNYPKGEKTREKMKDLLGSGIFNSDGEQWRSQRRMASMVFLGKTWRDFSLKCFRHDSLHLLHALRDAAASQSQSHSHSQSETVNLQALLMSMTMDSITKVGFGVHASSSGGSSGGGSYMDFAEAFDTVNACICRRYVNVWWKLHKWLRMGTEGALYRELHNINTFAANLISQHRHHANTTKPHAHAHGHDDPHITPHASVNHRDNTKDHDSSEDANDRKYDLLSRLIQIEKYPDGDIGLRDSIFNFMLAGRDTTAVTMSWFIYNVCQKKEVERKIYEEVMQVLGYHNIEAFTYAEVANHLTYEALSNMNYLHAALTETLRLHPAVPRDTKVAINHDVLPDGTIVKAGDHVAFVPYSMGRMKFLWGDDALEFKPERWLHDGLFRAVSPFKFTAFQGGPRTCLGKDWAYLQMKMAMALILYFFEFKLVSKEIKYRMMMVLAMENGLQVTVQARKIPKLQGANGIL